MAEKKTTSRKTTAKTTDTAAQAKKKTATPKAKPAGGRTAARSKGATSDQATMTGAPEGMAAPQTTQPVGHGEGNANVGTALGDGEYRPRPPVRGRDDY